MQVPPCGILFHLCYDQCTVEPLTWIFSLRHGHKVEPLNWIVSSSHDHKVEPLNWIFSSRHDHKGSQLTGDLVRAMTTRWSH